MMYSVITNHVKAFDVLGSPYLEQKELDGSEFERRFFERHSLSSLSGFFALLSHEDEFVRLVVDRVRSIPLFYAVKNDKILFSSDYAWLHSQLQQNEECEQGRAEFALTGYVCADRTLSKQIKQVEAGQEVIICKRTGTVSKSNYFLFQHHEPEVQAESLYVEQLDIAVRAVFKRLIEFAAGRQIVLPLSGGFDSRLIASTIKQLGYQNVVCFSYGLTGNKEATLSKQIATGLGFQWYFVEYNEDKWRNAWFSDEADEFREMASNGVSLPHIQDWLAVRELKDKQLISSDAVFVPGHSGDFVAGSHIPDIVFEQQQFSKSDLTSQLLTDHYKNVPRQLIETQIFNQIRASLQEQLSGGDALNAEAFANQYELWDWRERQAKYIINSVRVYEFFGMQWWLPLWDKEFVEFWCEMPLQYRKKRLWYNAYVADRFKSIVGAQSEIADKNAADFSFARRLAHRLYQVMPTQLKQFIYGKKLRNDFDNHFLAFGALLSDEQKDEYAKFGYTMIGVYSLLFLQSRWGNKES
ncbi:hypothetical protein CBQ28_03745 [Pseudoalteromonas sp. GCY]|uniref:asparagine synthase family protein n=1 Tax=Pseudoalteromonas sp. GCY TaxID=2003316 RepID=UPI000BFF0AD2|nr:asparagine synthetase B family protein [Pseudoalteromonas sp. GCY]PHI38642.1 hypothetical protein CBQ28_03745 [Pseudoalteromonas sp. GCY]QQQ67734.1 hypothetical protein JJQ94_07950 [Pseudoalteromonas sp. GCY]